MLYSRQHVAASKNKKVLFLLSGLVLAAVAGELGFRLLAPRVGIDTQLYERLGQFVWTGKGEYVPHPYSGFVRPADEARQRTYGLADERRSKKSELPRILCLGGSTTEGGNPDGWRGTYPAQLATELAEKHGVKVEVVNGGVSGWTSAETLTAYVLNYQDFSPDVVLIHHAINDIEPMNAPEFRSDYSHWRVPMRELRPALWERVLLRSSYLYAHLTSATERFSISGATKIESPDAAELWSGSNGSELAERTFARNIESVGRIAALDGAQVALLTMPFAEGRMNSDVITATATNNRILREVAAANGWLLVDLDQEFRGGSGDGESVSSEFLDAVHLTADGNRRKALILARELVKHGVLHRSQ